MIQAINGPLQQRTSVLDSDFSNANTFPQDYDTDLESDWSNLSMIFSPIIDGNFFSDIIYRFIC